MRVLCKNEYNHILIQKYLFSLGFKWNNIDDSEVRYFDINWKKGCIIDIDVKSYTLTHIPNARSYYNLSDKRFINIYMPEQNSRITREIYNLFDEILI